MNRRRIEVAVLVFGVVFSAVVVLSVKRGMRPSASASGTNAPLPAGSEGGHPTTVLSGFDYTETVKGKPAFRIRSERTVGFGPVAGLAPDRYALEKVSLTLYPENGEPLDVLADRADYDMRTKAALLNGNVRWSDEKGALGETETVSFHPEKRLLEAPKKIHFSQGSFDVVGSSGRYDLGRRETILSGPVRGSGTGEGTGGLSHVEADSATYKRDEQVIELEGHVKTSARQGDRLECDRLLIKTNPEGKHLEWARATGSVRGRMAGAAAAAAGATPAPGASAPPDPPRDYAGDLGILLFGPDGLARSMSLAGHPASVAEAQRRITAETIDLDLAGGKPAAARAQGGVRLDAPPNSSESDKATVAYGPDGAVTSLELSGNVRMSGDGKAGTAQTAIQVPARSVWLLTGSASASATVVSGGSKISAPRIEIGEKRRDLTAEGGARAVFAPEKGKPVSSTPLGDPSQPTYGKASRIVLNDVLHVATLSGAASLWQEASSLAADDITINDVERTLVATGNVRAVMPPQSPPPLPRLRRTRPPRRRPKKPASRPKPRRRRRASSPLDDSFIARQPPRLASTAASSSPGERGRRRRRPAPCFSTRRGRSSAWSFPATSPSATRRQAARGRATGPSTIRPRGARFSRASQRASPTPTAATGFPGRP